ncbi:MAG: hypothetical protein KJ952_03550 [Candidatus Omnitrophica bacterium]|nr:hypothetical protein [Candidatus Omnitrophota bacterium]
MKKMGFIVLSLIIFLASSAYALDTALFDMRNEVFEESKEIKLSLTYSKDVVLMSSMWDSCIMVMVQLDAYFYMLRIFNTIETEDLKQDAVDTLISWLNDVKKTNEMNVKSLDSVSETAEAYTKVHLDKLKTYFGKLNTQIDIELDKIFKLRKSLKK